MVRNDSTLLLLLVCVKEAREWRREVEEEGIGEVKDVIATTQHHNHFSPT
jgi:hypothetical protein